jgi:hypothetical protein
VIRPVLAAGRPREFEAARSTAPRRGGDPHLDIKVMDPEGPAGHPGAQGRQGDNEAPVGPLRGGAPSAVIAPRASLLSPATERLEVFHG